MKQIASLVLLVLLVLSSNCSMGQDNIPDYKQNIKSDFQKFIEATNHQEIDAIVHYFPDGFFELINEDEMRSALESQFSNGRMIVHKTTSTILSIKDAISSQGNYYSKLEVRDTYYVSLRKMVNESEENYKKAVESTVKSIEKGINLDYRGEVTYNNLKQRLVVTETKEVYAFSDSQLNSWKFLVDEDTTRKALFFLIPFDVYQKFNPLYRSE